MWMVQSGSKLVRNTFIFEHGFSSSLDRKLNFAEGVSPGGVSTCLLNVFFFASFLCRRAGAIFAGASAKKKEKRKSKS